MLAGHGFDGLDSVIHPGLNGKMSEVSAGMGLVNLGSVLVMAGNRHRYSQYRDGFATLEGVRLLEIYTISGRPNYQNIVVELQHGFPIDRDRMLQILHVENVRARRYFWPGCHRMSRYREQLCEDDVEHLVATEAVAGRVIVLPNGSRFDHSAIDQIISVFRVVLEGAVH